MGTLRPAHADELEQRLRSVAPVALVPRQAFREELRDRLMAEAADLAVNRTERAPLRPVERATGRPRFQRSRRTLAGVVVTAVLGSGAAAAASTSAVPGDALYGLKRTFEDARMQLAVSDAARAGAALSQARERLAEAEELALSEPGGADKADTPQMREALRDFASHSADGVSLLLQHYADEGDPASLADIDAFARETRPLLERLRAETPASLHPVIDGLIAGLRKLDADLASTVAACGDACTSAGLRAAQPQWHPQPQPGMSGPERAVPGALNALVPTDPPPGDAAVPPGPDGTAADPGAPDEGLLPGVAPPLLPGRSSTPAVPPPSVTDPLPPVTDPAAPVTDPLLTPTPEPEPTQSSSLPCILNLIGDCPD